jgi:hypothetical protein
MGAAARRVLAAPTPPASLANRARRPRGGPWSPRAAGLVVRAVTASTVKTGRRTLRCAARASIGTLLRAVPGPEGGPSGNN